jgi:hypothetical protein
MDRMVDKVMHVALETTKDLERQESVITFSIENSVQDKVNVFNLKLGWARVTEGVALFSSHGRGGSIPLAA